MRAKRSAGSLNLLGLLRRRVPVPTDIISDRFWRKVERRGSDECWAWTGGQTGNGYGTFKMPKMRYVTVSAHRLAHFLHNGAWPADGLVVRHSCDNPLCCNPAHLDAGTQGQNIQDQYDRNRRGAEFRSEKEVENGMVAW